MSFCDAFLLHITLNGDLLQTIIVIIIRYIFYQRWCRKLWVQPCQTTRAQFEQIRTVIISAWFEPPCLNCSVGSSSRIHSIDVYEKTGEIVVFFFCLVLYFDVNITRKAKFASSERARTLDEMVVVVVSKSRPLARIIIMPPARAAPH